MSVSQRLVNGVFYDLQNGLKCMKRDKYKPGTGWHFTAMKAQNAGKLKLWGVNTCMGIFHARRLGLVIEITRDKKKQHYRNKEISLLKEVALNPIKLNK